MPSRRNRGCERLGRGEFGLTFRHGDTRALKHTIGEILFDEQLGGRLGEAGRKCILENYTWDLIARKVEDICREILSRA